LRKFHTIKVAFALVVISTLASSYTFGQQYTCQVLYWLQEPSGISGINTGSGPFATNVGPLIGGQGVSVGTGHLPEMPENQSHALYWSTTGNVADLNPTALGFVDSGAAGSDGVNQVGAGSLTTSESSIHALLWSGTANSAVDLNPASFTSSYATGVGGNQQVGYGNSSNGTHALLWTGTAASAVDLNPDGFQSSAAYATDGNYQVGAGYNPAGLADHALLWSGSADSVVDLSPTLPGIYNTLAMGVGGGQQVGYGTAQGSPFAQAILWSGTAASAVDLNPTSLGMVVSRAYATNGSVQVGVANNNQGGPNQAIAWFGSAASAINLQDLIPDASSSSTSSTAYSIDSNGNIFGIAHGTIGNLSGFFAIEWSPVPEPGVLFPMVLIAMSLHRRRRTHD
jgi:hypothetical protein